MRYLGKVPSFAASRVVFDDGTEFSGSYTDLTDKPTIPSGLTDLGIADGTNGQILSTNGAGSFVFIDAPSGGTEFSGSYTDLTDKPTIPSGLTDLGITDGTNGQILSTDGAGSFVFIDAPSGGGASAISGFTTAGTAATNGASVVIGDDLYHDSDPNTVENVQIGAMSQIRSGSKLNVVVGYDSDIVNSNATATLAVGAETRVSYGYSSAVGYKAISNGQQAQAFGSYSEATNTNANAYGYYARAQGNASTAIGYFAYASSTSAVAIGNADATSNYAVAIGRDAAANAYYSTAIGYQSTASSQYGSALGSRAYCSSSASEGVAVGYSSTSSAYRAVAMGRAVTAQGNYSTIIGQNAFDRGYGNVLVLKAGTQNFSVMGSDRCYISPVREATDPDSFALKYNPSSAEITWEQGGGGGGVAIENEGGVTASSLNFVGSGGIQVTTSNNSGAITVTIDGSSLGSGDTGGGGGGSLMQWTRQELIGPNFSVIQYYDLSPNNYIYEYNNGTIRLDLQDSGVRDFMVQVMGPWVDNAALSPSILIHGNNNNDGRSQKWKFTGVTSVAPSNDFSVDIAYDFAERVQDFDGGLSNFAMGVSTSANYTEFGSPFIDSWEQMGPDLYVNFINLSALDKIAPLLDFPSPSDSMEGFFAVQGYNPQHFGERAAGYRVGTPSVQGNSLILPTIGAPVYEYFPPPGEDSVFYQPWFSAFGAGQGSQNIELPNYP